MADKTKTAIRLTSIPRDLLEKFDRKIKGKYANRAEALRDLIRDFVEDNGLWRHSE